jgi:S-adenosylmethionine:tRNA ribosyltransferase-isomerase
VKTADFDFHLPPGQIALHPTTRREESRLLVLDRQTGARVHSRFGDVGRFLPPRSLLVLNETRVFPARLRARRPTGGQIELLLVRRVLDDVVSASAPDEGTAGEGAATGAGRREIWEAMARQAGNVAPGTRLRLVHSAADAFECEVTFLGKVAEGPSAASETPFVRLAFQLGKGDVLALAEACGEIPLPPYIEQGRRSRAASGGEPPSPHAAVDDRVRYQTVYARTPGAVAAPTAGLHFTESLLDELVAAGHEIARLVLHVGPGTFRPVKTEDPTSHVMDAEAYEIPALTADAVARARQEGRAVVAVGTTSVRALEAAARAPGAPAGGVRAGAGEARLFLKPGDPFLVVDGLVTNFHLPRSTLLMLVSALAGRDAVLDAYADAVARGYRFYSYGDAMLILPTLSGINTIPMEAATGNNA